MSTPKGSFGHGRSKNKLKKAALNIIAGQMSESEIAVAGLQVRPINQHLRLEEPAAGRKTGVKRAVEDLRETFKALDANGDGFLTVAELKDGIDKASLRRPLVDLEAVVEGVDADGSGLIVPWCRDASRNPFSLSKTSRICLF